MFKILRFLKPYTWQILLMVVLTYIQVTANLKLPDYMATIVNKGIVNGDTDLVWYTGYWMVAVTIAGAICTVIVGYLASLIGTGFAKHLRSAVFHKVENFSLTEFNKFSTSSLITRSTNDIQQVQTVLIIVFRLLLMAPLTAVGAVVSAYDKAPNMTWIMWLSVAVLLTIISVLFTLVIPKYSLLQKFIDKLNLVTRQNLTGIRVVRAFNSQKAEEEKFEDVNLRLTKLNLFINRSMVFLQPMMLLIFNLTVILIIWVGGHEVANNNLQIGEMIAFMQYSMQVIFSFLMISIVFTMIPRAMVSAKRIGEVLETIPEINDPVQSKNFPDQIGTGAETPARGLVEFKNVTFTYPGADAPVLQNISFVAHPGKTTAFIGSTGSGKSTVINLIPRFFDVTSGQILIDGIDIRDILQSELHKKIGYVPQKSVLFSGTIKSNLGYGAPNADEYDIEKAAEISQAKNFIEGLDDKYNSLVAQGGSNFSGGQKQRLSIARALMVKPEIYIFDDSFSALDFKTDTELRKALESETKNSTVLIVAQRIGTILNADQIVVLDEGRVVGIGNHKELMKSCEVYKEIALSQLSEKELEGI